MIYLTKLDLTLCQGRKIGISILVSINDTLDKHNPHSDYYNNICSKTPSGINYDITLKDRRKEFVNNNMSLCEENCELIDYNYTTKKVMCSCNVKYNITDNYNIKFNKNEFFKNFIDVKNFANLKLMKCYKYVYKIKLLKENYGFLIMVFIFGLYFLCLTIFCLRSYNKLLIVINLVIK